MKRVRQLIISLMGLDIDIQVLYGEESLNQPSVFHVELLLDYAINTDVCLGVTAKLHFILFEGGSVQKTMVVTSVSTEDSPKQGKAKVSLILQAPLALLRYSSQPRVFLNQSKLTVMKHVFIEKGIFKPEQCYFHLTKPYPSVDMMIQLYHESDFSFVQRLLAEEGLFYWLDGLDIHISDQVLCCPRVEDDYQYNPDDGLVYRFWSESTADHRFFQIHSYLAMMSPGQCITLDEQEYIVTEVKHYIKQASALNEDALPYWNHVSLQSRRDAKLVPERPSFPVPWCFQARVQSPLPSAYLDDQGRYHVKFLFDQNQDPEGAHSAFIPRVQCYGDDKQGSTAIGAHFPLYDGTEVLINCIDGDVYRPIILGALASSDHPSVVNRAYPNKNVMETASGCGLILDDQLQQSRLYTPKNHLFLDQAKQQIELLTESGDIDFYSKQQTVLMHGADVETQVGGHLAISADQSAVVTQTHQDLVLQSADDFQAIAQGDVALQAAAIELNALEELLVSAATVKQCLRQGKQIWQIKNSLVMKGKKIQLKSERLLVLSCMNSAIEITPDKISFFSKAIDIEVQACRIQANYSNFNDQACQLFKASPVTSLAELKALALMRDEQDLLILACHWNQSEARIGDQITAQCFVKNIADHVSGTLIVYCEDHQLVARQSFSIASVRDQSCSQHARLQIPWQVSESEASKRLASHEEVLYYFDVEIEGVDNQEPSTPLKILIDLSIHLSYQALANIPKRSVVTVTAPNKQSSLALVHDSNALARNIVIGKLALSLSIIQADKCYQQQMIYNDQQRQPWMNLQLRLAADLKSQSTTCKALLPPIFVRFDDKPGVDLRPVAVLSPETLAALRQSCHAKPINVTLFIHGYDVEPGKLGQCIESVKQESTWSQIERTFELTRKDDGLTVNFSDVDASVYQELSVLKQRFPIIKNNQDFLERYSVNGSGDHAWLLAIEHYANKAAGLDQKGYDAYQRMIGVCWPALPDSIVDYIQVTQRIRVIGQKTAGLIKQLLNAGFEVNVVAHSLGCGVLMQALNQLGQEPSLKKVNHCFLWEAAVPSTIFSTRGYDLQKDKASMQLLMERDLWYVPHAKDAAQKFVVLHSENDNVLGPIPQEQRSGKSQFYVNAQKPFVSELIPAVMLSFLELGSLYDIAMNLNIPSRDMIDVRCFSKIYRQWWQRYQPIQDKKGRFYPDSLDKRIAQLSNQEFLVAKYWIADQYQKNKEIIHQYIEAARKACKNTDVTDDLDYEVLAYMTASILAGSDWRLKLDDIMKIEVMDVVNMGEDLSDTVFVERRSVDVLYGLRVKLPILFNSMFMDNNIDYPCALGYQGADLKDPATQQLLSSGKLEQIDQTDCLFSHSGIKSPSHDLFQKIYQQALWQRREGFHFGGY